MAPTVYCGNVDVVHIYVYDFYALVGTSSSCDRTKRNVTQVLESLSEKGVYL